MNTKLQKICDEIDGALSVFICGYDGLLLDKYIKPNSAVDVDMIGAELSSVVSKLKNNSDKLMDMSLTFNNTVVAIKVFEEGFAGVIMSKDCNLGRCKIELNKMKDIFQ